MLINSVKLLISVSRIRVWMAYETKLLTQTYPAERNMQVSYKWSKCEFGRLDIFLQMGNMNSEVFANSTDLDKAAPENKSDQGFHCLPFSL